MEERREQRDKRERENWRKEKAVGIGIQIIRVGVREQSWTSRRLVRAFLLECPPLQPLVILSKCRLNHLCVFGYDGFRTLLRKKSESRRVVKIITTLPSSDAYAKIHAFDRKSYLNSKIARYPGLSVYRLEKREGAKRRGVRNKRGEARRSGEGGSAGKIG